MSDEARRKWFERDKPKGRINLTQADAEICRSVYEYGILSQDQIHRLSGVKHRNTTNRRLRRLYDHGYLWRQFLPVVEFGANPILYILDREGEDLLRRHHDIQDFSNQPGRDLSATFLNHTLAISEFRISLSTACQALGWKISHWVGESQIKQGGYDKVKLPHLKQPIAVAPDSYFVISIPGKGVSHFFLELDRGTMATKRFRRKIEAYVAYYKTGSFSKRYNARGFRVLTVVDTKTSSHTQTLAETASRVPQIGRRFWFGHLPAITPETALTGAIWTVAGQQTRRSLF